MSANVPVNRLGPVAENQPEAGWGQWLIQIARGVNFLLQNLGTTPITTVGDAAYQIVQSDRIVETATAFTAARIWTLPPANSVDRGYEIAVTDAIATITVANTLTVALSGADTINGAAASLVLNIAGSAVALVSDGLSNWAAKTRFSSFASGSLVLNGATSGTLTVKPAAVAGTNTLTLPAGTTDFSATGGTSRVVKQTTAGGAFTVATLAAADLNDTTTATSWTPTDQSGAALSFSSVSANYYKLGNIIFAYGTLTYPGTVDGSVAKISLPVAVPNAGYANAPGAVLSNVGSTGLVLQANQSTSTATFRVTPGGGATNVSLSGAVISFFIAYPQS